MIDSNSKIEKIYAALLKLLHENSEIRSELKAMQSKLNEVKTVEEKTKR